MHWSEFGCLTGYLDVILLPRVVQHICCSRSKFCHQSSKFRSIVAVEECRLTQIDCCTSWSIQVNSGEPVFVFEFTGWTSARSPMPSSTVGSARPLVVEASGRHVRREKHASSHVRLRSPPPVLPRAAKAESLASLQRCRGEAAQTSSTAAWQPTHHLDERRQIRKMYTV